MLRCRLEARRGEPDHETRPAVTSVLHPSSAPKCGGVFGDESEAKSCSDTVTGRAAARKAFENPRPFTSSNTRTGVFNSNDHGVSQVAALH